MIEGFQYLTLSDTYEIKELYYNLRHGGSPAECMGNLKEETFQSWGWRGIDLMKKHSRQRRNNWTKVKAGKEFPVRTIQHPG